MTHADLVEMIVSAVGVVCKSWNAAETKSVRNGYPIQVGLPNGGVAMFTESVTVLQVQDARLVLPEVNMRIQNILDSHIAEATEIKLQENLEWFAKYI